ncbi:MAG: biotin/lipoyl-containing protein, partial [Tahibacter sp.]
VWDRNREDALQRMREALAQTRIVGPKSNVEFLERLVRHPAIVKAQIDTAYLDRHLDEFLPADTAVDPRMLAIAASAILIDQEVATPQLAATGSDPHSPWARADGWRLGHPGKRVLVLLQNGKRHEIAAHGVAGNYTLDFAGNHSVVDHAVVQDGWFSAQLDGVTRRLHVSVDASGVVMHDGETRIEFERAAAFASVTKAAGSGDRVLAPMPGRVVLVRATVGDSVTEGQELAIMEAMKMELTLRSPRAGTIAAVQAQVGEFVEADAVLIRLEPQA